MTTTTTMMMMMMMMMMMYTLPWIWWMSSSRFQVFLSFLANHALRPLRIFSSLFPSLGYNAHNQ